MTLSSDCFPTQFKQAEKNDKRFPIGKKERTCIHKVENKMLQIEQIIQ